MNESHVQQRLEFHLEAISKCTEHEHARAEFHTMILNLAQHLPEPSALLVCKIWDEYNRVLLETEDIPPSTQIQINTENSSQTIS